MISASLPLPVFMKKFLSSPFRVVVILAVVENPDPPCEATVVVLGSRERAFMIAESSFMVVVVVMALRSAESIREFTSLLI